MSGILPKEGKLLTLILCRDIKEKLKITAEEVKKSGLETKGDDVSLKKDIDIKLDFTADELSLLKTSASKMDSDGKVNNDTFELIEKLIC